MELVYQSICLKNRFWVLLLFSVTKLSVSAGNTVELQLPKDETVLTCFVLEKENPGLSANFVHYQQIIKVCYL